MFDKTIQKNAKLAASFMSTRFPRMTILHSFVLQKLIFSLAAKYSLIKDMSWFFFYFLSSPLKHIDIKYPFLERKRIVLQKYNLFIEKRLGYKNTDTFLVCLREWSALFSFVSLSAFCSYKTESTLSSICETLNV